MGGGERPVCYKGGFFAPAGRPAQAGRRRGGKIRTGVPVSGLQVTETLVVERVLDAAVLVGVFFPGLLCLLPSWASVNPAAARTIPNA